MYIARRAGSRVFAWTELLEKIYIIVFLLSYIFVTRILLSYKVLYIICSSNIICINILAFNESVFLIFQREMAKFFQGHDTIIPFVYHIPRK